LACPSDFEAETIYKALYNMTMEAGTKAPMQFYPSMSWQVSEPYNVRHQCLGFTLRKKRYL